MRREPNATEKSGSGKSSPGTHETRPTVDQLTQGVRTGDRAMLGRAITLVESTNFEDRLLAEDLIQALMQFSGKAQRVGVTGVPGVGKSTFIEALGTMLTGAGHRVAVLAVDPSSQRTGGSILGDKTRMPRLSVDQRAFVRPSPTAGTLGGVTRRTRESMIVCEAAGYDVILVETVGAGQSETAVSDMVDFFLVLMLPGAGDDLQGIKKGVLEIADMLAVNKADGDNLARARAAAADYRSALRIVTPRSATWTPPVLLCSGRTGEGLDQVWTQIERHRSLMEAEGELHQRRVEQLATWTRALVDEAVLDEYWHRPGIPEHYAQLEAEVVAGRMSPGRAARLREPGPEKT